MTDFNALIRLHRWRLEEKQRALAELRSLEEQLRAEANRLEEEIKAEQEAARDTLDGSMAYAGYARNAIVRRGRIARSIADVERRIAGANEEMAAAFQELKRYELAQEDRERRRQREIKRKEEAALDETAAVMHTRRRREDA